mgnify:CR=1 FL=1
MTHAAEVHQRRRGGVAKIGQRQVQGERKAADRGLG